MHIPAQRSHDYHVTGRDLAQLLLWPLIGIGAFMISVHAAVHLNALPPARPCADVEQTVMVHQADASRTAPVPEVLLCGDSSCLMNVNARLLEQQLKVPCLNLGTLSYLDLESHGLLANRLAARHAARPQWIVVLMHPEAIRRVSGDAYYMDFVRDYLEGFPPKPVQTLETRARALLGIEDFESRIWLRLCPVPLPGAFGRYYGFNWNLESYMNRHHGSALDPGQRPFTGNAEYQLAMTLQSQSRRFRASLPHHVRLAVGITPVPEGFAPKEYPALSRKMLEEWGQWLGAEILLVDLARILPDASFASVTHLHQDAIAEYTRQLALVLETSLTLQPQNPAR